VFGGRPSLDPRDLTGPRDCQGFVLVMQSSEKRQRGDLPDARIGSLMRM